MYKMKSGEIRPDFQGNIATLLEGIAGFWVLLETSDILHSLDLKHPVN